MNGHKARDWGPFGSHTEKKMKRMGGSSGGSQTPPRRKRRTIKHLKGKGYPGQWRSRPVTVFSGNAPAV